MNKQYNFQLPNPRGRDCSCFDRCQSQYGHPHLKNVAIYGSNLTSSDLTPPFILDIVLVRNYLGGWIPLNSGKMRNCSSPFTIKLLLDKEK